jgi:hypothetical protein
MSDKEVHSPQGAAAETDTDDEFNLYFDRYL